MAKLSGTPVGRRWSGASPIQEEEVELYSDKLSKGINTYLDPADIDLAQVQVGQNVRIYGDAIYSRDGSSNNAFVAQGTPPTTDAIQTISRFARFDGTAIYVFFTKTEVWRRGPASWIQITGPAITVPYREQTLAINDRFFFTTGRDEIMEIDFGGNTYAPLGNAPKYKYICGFFNRIVGANLYDSSTPPNNPVQVGWSGDLNFDEWSPLTDISAGNVALVEGQGDFSDEITGLFGFASVMLIMREKSLWTATKRPVASLPFQFTASYPNVGCDSPDSIAQTKNGLAWYDFRSNQVYAFEIGGSPIPIGTAIRKDLDSLVTDNKTIQGSYDPIKNRYHLCIPSTNSSYTIVYVFDFDTASWVRDDRYLVNVVAPLDEIVGELVYDDLVGVYDDLIGVYDDLSSITVSPSIINYGLQNGILLQDDDAINSDNGVLFGTVIQSKVFTLPSKNISVARLTIKYKPRRNGSFDLSYSRNGGRTFEPYKTVTFGTADIGQRKIATFWKQITTSEYVWKLQSLEGSCDILEYRVLGVQTTDTRAK